MPDIYVPASFRRSPIVVVVVVVLFGIVGTEAGTKGSGVERDVGRNQAGCIITNGLSVIFRERSC